MKVIRLALCSIFVFVTSLAFVKADDVYASEVKWSPDGRWIAVNASNGLWIFDTENPDSEPSIYFEGETISLIAFNPVNNDLAILLTDWENNVHKSSILNLETRGSSEEYSLHYSDGEQLQIYAAYSYEMHYTNDGSYLVMTSGNGLLFFDPSFRRVLARQFFGGFGDNVISFSQIEDTGNFLALTWASENSFAMINRDAGLVSSYAPETRGDTVYYLADTRALLLGYQGINIFDVGSKEESLLISAPEGNGFSSYAYSAATGTLLVGGHGIWQTIDVATASVNLSISFEVEFQNDRFAHFDFSPDSSQFVSLQSDGKITVWDTATGEIIETFGSFTGGTNNKWG